jgi:tRNA G18 (ribose-2'-O)-methylase SpoU
MKKEKEFFVVLEKIRSIYNVGSIFRTAEGLGFSEVFLCGYTPAPSDGERQKSLIHKTALGAEEYIKWKKVKSCSGLLTKLKKENIYIIGLENVKNSIPIKKLKIPKKFNKIALILGHEVEGISEKIIKKCDVVVEIPMLGMKESFNVSVAFGIAGFWMKNI